jgi:hypothetical protein
MVLGNRHRRHNFYPRRIWEFASKHNKLTPGEPKASRTSAEDFHPEIGWENTDNLVLRKQNWDLDLAQNESIQFCSSRIQSFSSGFLSERPAVTDRTQPFLNQVDSSNHNHAGEDVLFLQFHSGDIEHRRYKVSTRCEL